ncbi:MAG: hypothetical protein COU06_02710 [Candidatus Harrisonbacteria bacterium CG10_big_fil_rev_8_21_14_0_10_38_8]|uniref:tRNA uridine(34) hydroxylase n=1 Tax=Candidatus Harrisonbacteria bacterium CG10_big_fil_rev_8_21_14_0_10_38_8 TaxID=1974582 RepID=A0A2M6WJE1_9BACT|nr:MAG: hypothetical protein COU06_02710 [Candidatus Harrisonbacteria bacterium CG10_big_fil_rev_8_21_14_0_10_38_8]
MYTIILFYKYVTVEDPDKLKEDQLILCKKLNLKGRIIISKEGINATIEGLTKDIDQYLENLLADSRFTKTHIKKSIGTGSAFPRLSVKVRKEIVSLQLESGKDINPNELTGKKLKPEELHSWYQNNEDFLIVDMRNTYEFKSGHFKDSVLPSLNNFRDLKREVNKLKKYKDKKILTVCTGGVRCEKASGYLLSEGFKDVYQLDGGIVSYMEKYPNKNFLGKLYVFDNRKVMGFDTMSQDHQVIGRCELCKKPSDYYVNCANLMCHKHFIGCISCEDKKGETYCSLICKIKNILKRKQLIK